MPYIVRNISGGFKILLKHQVAPGGTLDLEEVFEGFCKPKRAKKNEEAKYAEWSEDQFPEFLERVEQDYANDRRAWVLEYTDGPRRVRGAAGRKKDNLAKKKDEIDETVSKREKRQKDAHTSRKQVRRALEGGMTPKELAWLPSTEASKKIIDNCSNALALKHAIKLARNLAGQEHIRDLLERRLIELGDRLAV